MLEQFFRDQLSSVQKIAVLGTKPRIAYALLNLNSICWWCWYIVTDEREVEWKSVKSPRRQANYQCLIPLTQSSPGGMTGFATARSLKTDIEWVLLDLWVFIILICNNDLTAISHPVSMSSFKSMHSLPVYLLFVFVHSDVYSIQHYVIKFVSDLRHVGGFLWVLRFPPPIKLSTTI